MIIQLDKYDGYLLHQPFAFRFFGKDVSPLGDIISFRAPMEVLEAAMIDQEDVLAKAFIWSDDAINFLWELPQLSNIFGAISYQRLFNSKVAEILSGANCLNMPIIMRGDDLLVASPAIANGWAKASVSITHVKNNVTLGHLGINVYAGKNAPPHAYSTQLSDVQTESFMKQVEQMFIELNRDIFIASTKVIVK
jgi:hypothetical protein